MRVEDVRKVCVLGAGAMGAGIAQACSQAGFAVSMRDIEHRFVEAGFQRIRMPLMRRVEHGKMDPDELEDILARIEGTTDLPLAVEDAQLVIEAVPEKMDLKRQVLREVDGLCPHDTIFASNTSSLSITEMASATKRADRFVGMHFFNPAPVMKLVEVIRGSETSADTVEFAKAFCKKLEKEPIVVKESPGFVVNRILVPMINEAFNLLMEGVASAEDIDKAMKLGTNMPMGPLELADFTGLDVCLNTMEILFRETGDPKFRPSPLLRQFVRAGRLGRKTGKGVFRYGPG